MLNNVMEFLILVLEFFLEGRKVATDQNEVKLEAWADKIEDMLYRQESKGNGFIALNAEECTKLIEDLRDAASSLDGWANGW